jgi:nucleoside 2-deoxyribosyltransferase
MKLYLAGPMTGHPELNFPTFFRYAKLLRERGHEVVNPAEESMRLHGLTWDGRLTDEAILELATTPWDEYLDADLRHIDEADALAVLPGWEESDGALREVAHARTQAKPVYSAVLLASSEPGAADVSDYADESYDPREIETTDQFVFYEADPERHTSQHGGVKDNVNKPRLDLIPALPLFKTGEVLAFGARKYKPHNWRLGLSWLETFGSLERHLHAWLDGEDVDRESGYHHLAHAMCQLLFLSEFVFRGTGEDDRFVSIDSEEAKT